MPSKHNMLMFSKQNNNKRSNQDDKKNQLNDARYIAHVQSNLWALSKKIKLKYIDNPGIKYFVEKLVSNNTTFDVAVYRPTEMKDKYSTFIYYPGTGFSLFHSVFPHIECSNLISNLKKCCPNNNWQVMFILDQPLINVNKHNTLLDVKNQHWKILKSLISNYSKFKIDLNNVILGGYSAGGNIAMSMLIRSIERSLKERVLPLPIKKLILIEPFLNLSKSAKYNYADRVVNQKIVDVMVRACVPSKLKSLTSLFEIDLGDLSVDSYKISPVFCPRNIKKKLNTPISIFTGKNDFFYEDAKELKKLIVNSEITEYGTEEKHNDHSLPWNSKLVWRDIAKSMLKKSLINAYDNSFFTKELASTDGAAPKKLFPACRI